jgi:SAM-dependent MidA family methyltransferase
MSNVSQFISEEIDRAGPMTFARFMELALYCPNFGYYERADGTPGRAGDFFTSVSVGKLFGELLAAQFAVWLQNLPGPNRQILETGAHDGQLAADILRSLQTNHPGLTDTLEYWILEPSARRQLVQENTLKEFACVRWFKSWPNLPNTGVSGIIFSNELLDAMPVHRLGWDAQKRNWFEWGVGRAGDSFVWRKLEGRGAVALLAADFGILPTALLDVLPDGFTTEVCPASTQWWRDAAGRLKHGKLLAFDYGLSAEEFFAPERSEGTVRAYHQHRQNNDLLARVGEQDLTAHVNFSAIRVAGESAGLRTETLANQGTFLVQVLAQFSKNGLAFDGWDSAKRRQFQTLTHPEHLGKLFRVLVQSR